MNSLERLQRNIDRVRSARAPDPEGLRRREAVFAGHVAKLTARLRPIVRRALVEEASKIVSGEWANDARALALWLVRGEPTQSGSNALVSALDAIRSRLVAGNGTKALDEATMKIASDLSKSLREEAASQPSDDEVDEHATELAQLLLSNWFGTLEHAFASGVGAMHLSAHVLPDDGAPELLVEGCEAFAVPPSESAKAVLDYQRSLVAGVGQSAELSPSLILYRTPDGWQIARPNQPLLPARVNSRVQPVKTSRRPENKAGALNDYLAD